MPQDCAVDDGQGALLSELTTGFEVLMQKADELSKVNFQLLDCIKRLQEEQQHFTPNKSLSTSSAFPDLSSLESEVRPDWRVDPRIDKGVQAWKLLKIVTMSAVPLRGDSARRVQETVRSRTGTSTQDASPAAVDMEQDFTTEGPKGDLRCPFSRANTGNDLVNGLPEGHPAVASHRGSNVPDPIAVEFHGVAPEAAKPPSVAASASKCPIRYMDQHSPEEVAKYFENHKHEIPRSHEICVRRYQTNEESIRALDAKYGSLVKMIQSLGEVHKPMLPAKEAEDEEKDRDSRSMEKVQRWAQDCAHGDDSLAPPPPDAIAEDGGVAADAEAQSETRTGHFDRPLREVRLGESPSRPWGIQVPYSQQAAASSVGDNKNAPLASSVALPPQVKETASTAPPVVSKCPFHAMAAAAAAPGQPVENPHAAEARTSTDVIVDQPQSEAQVLARVLEQRAAEKMPSQIVFNGPVFFGYPAESAATLLKSLRGD